MTPIRLIIYVDFEDETDCDFAREKLMAVVEDRLIDLEEEKRLDGKWDVSWDTEDVK